jgi:hypothetical protein
MEGWCAAIWTLPRPDQTLITHIRGRGEPDRHLVGDAQRAGDLDWVHSWSEEFRNYRRTVR